MKKYRIEICAFTLLEILIAASVLAIFLTGVYQIYRGVNKSFKQANWSLVMQTEARNGLNFIREEMQRASYSTHVRIDSIDVNESQTMKIHSGTTQADGNTHLLASWAIGIPFRDDVPNTGACFQSKLELSGKNLVYTKTLVAGHLPPEEITFDKKNLISNVASVSLSVNAMNIDLATSSQLVEIIVELHHPDHYQFPNTKVIEQTAAKVDVKVEEL